jgi:hypothetical protein
MKKPIYILILSLSFIAFTSTDCKHSTQPPDDTTHIDTTSHNFAWTSYTIGDASGGSSNLYDVAIINDTLAYAVGEFYINDTLYNTVVWNRNTWIPKRISVAFRGNIITPPLYGVFAFTPTDIWFVGSLPVHGDGINWTIYDLRSMSGLESISLTKAWGSSSTDMYFVGNSGSIAHYNGSSWSKIESGITLPFQDIFGATDIKTGEQEILTVASRWDVNQGKIVLRIKNDKTKTLPDSGLPWSLGGIWFKPNQQYYIVGDGIYYAHSPRPTIWNGGANQLTTFYTTKIRANDINDVFVVGAYGEILHYNGASWKSCRSQTALQNGSYTGIAVKSNLTIAVGADGARTVVTLGKR